MSCHKLKYKTKRLPHMWDCRCVGFQGSGQLPWQPEVIELYTASICILTKLGLSGLHPNFVLYLVYYVLIANCDFHTEHSYVTCSLRIVISILNTLMLRANCDFRTEHPYVTCKLCFSNCRSCTCLPKGTLCPKRGHHLCPKRSHHQPLINRGWTVSYGR